MKVSPQTYRLAVAASAFLKCIDNITSEAFSHGGDHEEREALRKVLVEMNAWDDR